MGNIKLQIKEMANDGHDFDVKIKIEGSKNDVRNAIKHLAEVY